MDKREWIETWGADALIHLAIQSHSLISDTDSDFLREYGLPRRLIFTDSGEAVESFEPRLGRLEELTSVELSGAEPEFLERMKGYVIIGETEFCHGEAFICIRQATGHVYRFDLEMDDAEDFVNSSVRQYGQSLLLVTQWSAASHALSSYDWIPSLTALREALLEVDGHAFDRNTYVWHMLIDHITNCESGSFTITTDLKMSKPRF